MSVIIFCNEFINSTSLRLWKFRFKRSKFRSRRVIEPSSTLFHRSIVIVFTVIFQIEDHHDANRTYIRHFELYLFINKIILSPRTLRITKTRLFQYIQNFTSQKLKKKKKKNQIKKTDVFSYICSNINYRYSLEPPGGGGSNQKPQSMFLS